MEQIFELYGGKVKGKFLGPTEENPKRHMYYVDGKRKKGVTTIIGIKDKSVALMSWQQEEIAKHLFSLLEKGKDLDEEQVIKAIFSADNKRDEAADLGVAVHDWVEKYIRHRLKEKGFKEMPEMPEDPNVLQGVTSFLEWEAQHKVKFLWTEKVLYSLKHNYIGKADFGAIVDGLNCLCDLKSGNGLYNSVRMQTAAYAMADIEERKVKYDGRWAIRVSKDTEEEYQKKKELKNKIKKSLGKNEVAMDENKGDMKKDFEAFLNAQALQNWDSETDFWKLKNRN
jgi:hypothetical protein